MNTANKLIPLSALNRSNASGVRDYVELNLTPEEHAAFRLRFVRLVNEFRAGGVTKDEAIAFHCNPYRACTNDYPAFVLDMTKMYDGHAQAVKVAA